MIDTGIERSKAIINTKIKIIKVINPLTRKDPEIQYLDFVPGMTAADCVKSDADLVVFVNGYLVSENDLNKPLLPNAEVLIAPKIDAQAVAAVGMILWGVVAKYAAGYAAGYLGYLVYAGLMVGGALLVNHFMTPSSEFEAGSLGDREAITERCYGWSMPSTTSKQDITIPVLYGTRLISGNILSRSIMNKTKTRSGGVLTEDLQADGAWSDTRRIIQYHEYVLEYNPKTFPVDLNFVFGPTTVTIHLTGYGVECYYIPAGTYTISAWIEAPDSTHANAWVRTYQWGTGHPEGKLPPYNLNRVYLTYTPDVRGMQAQGQYLYMLLGMTCHRIGSTSDIKLNNEVIGKYRDTHATVRNGVNDASALSDFNRVESYTAKDSTLLYNIPVESTTSGNAVEGLKADLVFKRGFYEANLNGSLDYTYINVKIEYKKTGGSWVTWDTVTLSGGETEALFFSFEIKNLTPGEYTIRLTRMTADSTNVRLVNECTLIGVSEVIYGSYIYPNVTLLGIKALATDQISGNNPQITCVMSREYFISGDLGVSSNLYEKPANNPAWAAYDVLTNTEYGEGIPEANMDLAAFTAWAAFCTTNSLTCNILFDGTSSAWDCAGIIAFENRGILKIEGTVVSVYIDTTGSSVQMFCAGNIEENSYKQIFLPACNRANCIEVSFWNEDHDYTREVFCVYLDSWNTDEEIKTNVTLFSITNYTQAVNYARLLLNYNNYLVRQCEFVADIDAISCVVGDIIKVQEDTSGRIVSSTHVNLVTNGNMEFDSDWSNFSSPSTNERSSAEVYEGSYSRHFVPSSNYDGIQGSTFTTVTDDVYKVSVWVKTTNDRFGISVRRGDGADWLWSDTVIVTPNTWTNYVAYHTETHGGAGAYIVLHSDSKSSGDYYIDSVKVETVASMELDTNLATNGTMEADSNWNDYGIPSTNERSSAEAHGGTYSRHFVPDAGYEGIQGDSFTTVTGELYKVVVWIKTSQNQYKISMRNGADTDWLWDSGDTAISPNVWTEIVAYVTETAGGAGAYIIVNSASKSSGDYYIDDIAIQKVTSVSLVSEVVLDQSVSVTDESSYILSYRLTDDTLLEKTYVATATESISTIALNLTTSELPAKYDIYAWGLSTLPYRLYRVIGITESEDLKRHLECIEYNESIYTDTPTVAAVAEDTYSLAANDLLAYEIEIIKPEGKRVGVQLKWRTENQYITSWNIYYRYKGISGDVDSDWNTYKNVRGTSQVVELNFLFSGYYEFAVAGVAPYGAQPPHGSTSVSIQIAGIATAPYWEDDAEITGIFNRSVELYWSEAITFDLVHYIVEYTELEVAITKLVKTNSFAIDFPKQTSYDFSVKAVDAWGNISSALEISLTNSVPVLGDIDVNFTGRDCILSWLASAELDFKKYVINVYSDNARTGLLRTEETQSPQYSYTFEKNSEDNEGYGGEASPIRTVYFTVTVYDIFDQTDSSNCYGYNPAPTIPSLPSLLPLFTKILVSWSRVSDHDLIGYTIYAGTSADNLSAVGFADSNRFSYECSAGVLYYIAIASVDDFGESDKSAIASATPFSIRLIDYNLDLPLTSNIDWSYDSNEIVWTSGQLAYKGTVYDIPSGSTSDTYVYWDVLAPTSFQHSSSRPSVGADIWLMGYFDSVNNEVHPAYQNKIIHAGILQASSITADLIGANEIIANVANIKDSIIQSAKIISLDASKIKVGVFDDIYTGNNNIVDIWHLDSDFEGENENDIVSGYTASIESGGKFSSCADMNATTTNNLILNSDLSLYSADDFSAFAETGNITQETDETYSWANGKGGNPSVEGSVVDATNLQDPMYLSIIGDYVFAIANDSHRLTVVNIATKTNPSVSGSVTDGTYLLSAYYVDALGDYAYVTGNAQNYFTVVDISNKSAPSVHGHVVDATNLLSTGGSKVLSGEDYALVTSKTNNRLTIIDLSDKANPSVHTSLQDNSDLVNPYKIDVDAAEDYAVITCQSSDSVTVVDISTISSPSVVGTVSDATYLEDASDIVVRGNYAYVSAYCGGSNGYLTVVDITTRSSPSVVGHISVGTGGTLGLDATENGDYCVVSCYQESAVKIYDMTTKSSPVLVGSIVDAAVFDIPQGIGISGNYIVTMSRNDDRLIVLNNGIAESKIVGSDYIEIDKTKDYILSAYLKKMAGVGEADVGLLCFDSNNSPCTPSTLYPVCEDYDPSTTTERKNGRIYDYTETGQTYYWPSDCAKVKLTCKLTQDSWAEIRATRFQLEQATSVTTYSDYNLAAEMAYALELEDDGTISMWINSLETTSDLLYDFYLFSCEGLVSCYYDASESKVKLNIAGTDVCEETISWSASTWHCVQFTWDFSSNSWTLKIDGGTINIDTTSKSWVSPPSNIYFGSDYNGENAFNGSIDEIRYDSAVTSNAYLGIWYARNKPFATENTFKNYDGNVIIDDQGISIIEGSLSIVDAGGNIVMKHGIITADAIEADTIVANHINGGAFGTLTISSGKIQINTSDALEITADGSMKMLEGSDINMYGDNEDVASINFYYDAVLRGHIAPNTHDDGDGLSILSPTDESGVLQLGNSSYRWNRAQLYTSGSGIDFLNLTDNTATQIDISTNGIKFCTSPFGDNTIETDYHLYHTAFYGMANKSRDLGTATYAWDDAYADDFRNVADFYHLDIYDDLGAIHAIQKSNAIDGATGMPLIDDNTIPKWLLSKHSKDITVQDDEGKIIETHKKGDIMYDSDKKPYLSLKTMISLLMGAVKQLDNKIERIQNEREN